MPARKEAPDAVLYETAVTNHNKNHETTPVTCHRLSPPAGNAGGGRKELAKEHEDHTQAYIHVERKCLSHGTVSLQLVPASFSCMRI